MPAFDSRPLHPRVWAAIITAVGAVLGAIITIAGGLLLFYLSHSVQNPRPPERKKQSATQKNGADDALDQIEKAKYAAMLELNESELRMQKEKFTAALAKMQRAFERQVAELRKKVDERNNNHMQHRVTDLRQQIAKLTKDVKGLSQDNQLKTGENSKLRKTLDQLRNDNKKLLAENERSRRAETTISLLDARLAHLAKLESALNNLRAEYKKKFDYWKNADVLPQYQRVAIWNYEIIEKYYKHQIAKVIRRRRELLGLRASAKWYGAGSSEYLGIVPTELRLEPLPKVFSAW